MPSQLFAKPVALAPSRMARNSPGRYSDGTDAAAQNVLASPNNFSDNLGAAHMVIRRD